MTIEILFAGLLIITGVLAFLLYQERRQRLEAAAEIQHWQAQATAAEAQHSEHERNVQRLAAQITQSDNLILQLQHKTADMDSQLDTKKQEVARKDDIIHNLRGQIQNSEKASQQSQALYSAFSGVAYDLVFVLDEDFTITAMNRSAEALLGDKHPIGDRLSDVLDAPDLDNLVQRSPEEAEGLEEQFLIQGRYYRVRTRIIPYTAQHTFIGVAMQDITQLVKLNRARRDMVANISHELGGPIANIRLIIDSLFYDADKPKRKESIASLHAIASEVDALQYLSREMLDLSMIDSGQALMKLKEESLHEILEESLERLNDQLEEKKLTVAQYIPARIKVLCDREHIRRVVMNLMRNAIKYSPEKEVISVSASSDGDMVTVYVLDNGPGVPEKERERIFERFYQVETSRTRDGGGSGLGLAICKHIVEAHEGTIRAESNTSGAGGRFAFTLIDATGELITEMEDHIGQHDDGLNKLIGSRYPANMDKTEETASEDTQPEA